MSMFGEGGMGREAAQLLLRDPCGARFSGPLRSTGKRPVATLGDVRSGNLPD